MVLVLSHWRGRVGSLALCLYCVSSFIKGFCSFLPIYKVMSPFIDVPPAHLAKDGFTGSWSLLCNVRFLSQCITCIHVVVASSLALTPRQILLFPNKTNIANVM